MSRPSKPKVSVVIPNYNHARYLRQRVGSVLEQTCQDFELILLDDCSTDDSRSILSLYAGNPRVRIEFNEVNSGSTFKQWNKGVRLARGEYVWIAESDDYADPHLLEKLVSRLDSEPEAAFVYCRSRRLSEHGELDGFQDPYLPDVGQERWISDFWADGREECRNYLVRCNTVPNASAVVFRKSVYEYLGGADENLRLCGDWKLWASMAMTGKVLYVGEPLNYYRFHGAGISHRSRQNRSDIMEILQVISWIADQTKPPASVMEKVRESQAAHWVPVIMSMGVPFGTKKALLRYARVLDPHPVRSAVRPVLMTVRLKFLRHWQEMRSVVMEDREM
jgi:glycosyltransferase involved in cell wall biosynthesis